MFARTWRDVDTDRSRDSIVAEAQPLRNAQEIATEAAPTTTTGHAPNVDLQQHLASPLARRMMEILRSEECAASLTVLLESVRRLNRSHIVAKVLGEPTPPGLGGIEHLTQPPWCLKGIAIASWAAEFALAVGSTIDKAVVKNQVTATLKDGCGKLLDAVDELTPLLKEVEGWGLSLAEGEVVRRDAGFFIDER